MADVVTRLVVESKEYDSKIARATSGLTQFEKKCREAGMTLEFVEKEDLAFVQALGKMDTVATTATGKLGEMTKAFTELSVQYKNLTDAEKQSPYGKALAGSLNQLKGRISDLGGQIANTKGELAMSGTVFEKLGSKMGLPAEAVGKLGSALSSLGPAAAGAVTAIKGAAGKIGIVIAGIVAVVKQLIDAFKRNEDAIEATSKIAAPFKAIWQSIQRIFDDVVKTFINVYNNIEKAVGGFSAFRIVLSPVAAAIAAVRAGLAVIGTLLTDAAKGVAFVAEKVRGAIAGSKVQSFFQGITDSIQGFFTKFTGWIEKLANSSLGKKLGLDALYIQLKDILRTQGELTESNRKIAEQENELHKLRRSTSTANTNRDADISELRAKASDRSAYSADERVGFLEKALELEKKNLEANINLRTKEYELIKLKNSLTQSGTQDLDAENEALNNITRARIEYNNQVRAMQRQIQAARNEAAGGGSGATSEATPLEGSIAWQEKEVARLTLLWKNATGDGVDEYKRQLDEAKKVLEDMVGKAQKLDDAFTPGSLRDLQNQLREAQDKLANMSPEAEGWAEALQDVANKQEAVNALQEKMNGNLEKTSEAMAEVKSTWESINEGVDTFSSMTGAMDGLKSSVEDLTEAFSGEKDAWDSMMTVINSGISIMQNVMGIMEAMNTLTELSTSLKQANTIATETEAATSVASAATETGAEAAKAAANMTTAGTAAAASSAEAGSAVAGIPIVGPILAVAAIAAVLAATMVAISKAKSAGSFSNGGIVGGNSFSGDNLLASVNSQEVVLNAAQTQNLAGQLRESQPTIGIVGRISGRDILLAADNSNASRGGRRGTYANVKG